MTAIRLPRMTTIQRDAISKPATGLEVYNTDTKVFHYFNGAKWSTFKILDQERVTQYVLDSLTGKIK